MNRARLPVTWPLALAFAFYPVWWLLGIGSFIWLIVALPIVVAIIARRWARAPVAIVIWFAFSSWVLMSGLQLHGLTKYATFGYRLSLYVVGGILFLYVYNLPRSGQASTKVLRILTLFWVLVVACGYAGIALRSFTFVPPFEHLLPGSVRNKPFTQELVRPVFAEVQSFLGFPIPRPSAPFAYTNNFGANMGVLTPIALAAIISSGPGTRRKLLIGVLIAAVVPMVFSLNRGMFLSVGVGVLYVAFRLAARGRVTALAAVFSVTALAVLVVLLTPLGGLVTSSFNSTHGHSNETRASVYQQAVQGANQSPLIGYGAPQQAAGAKNTPAIGTQGQLWMVLYSNGYPALVLFIVFFLVVLWQTRRARGTAGLFLHSVPLVGLAQIVFYGWLPVELQVIMVASALAYRLCWRSGTEPGRRTASRWQPLPQSARPAAGPAADAAGGELPGAVQDEEPQVATP
jgi:polysaccharide biosynthesis protein PslJ